MRPVLPFPVVGALTQGDVAALRVGHPMVGILHLQPAGRDAPCQQPLQRGRRRPGQVGAQPA
jgi:hypothetical protein